MLPTLSERGDWVYISKLYRRGKGIVVGDLVSVKHPMFHGEGASKRILGLAGDFVVMGKSSGGGKRGEEEMMIQVGFRVGSCL